MPLDHRFLRIPPRRQPLQPIRRLQGQGRKRHFHVAPTAVNIGKVHSRSGKPDASLSRTWVWLLPLEQAEHLWPPIPSNPASFHCSPCHPKLPSTYIPTHLSP